MGKPRGHINTPAKFAAAREHLGMSKSALARTLRLAKAGYKTIVRIEAGQSVPGPYQIAMEALLSGWRPHGVKLPIDARKA